VRLVIPPGVFKPPSDAFLLARSLRDHAPGADVLDLCTGSGVLAVAAGLAGAQSVTAVDISRRAVLAARLNGALNGVRIRARRGDLLNAVPGEQFDVIVANPPYLPELAGDPRGLERATEAGFDGRRFVDRVIEQAPEHLRPGGVLLLVHSSVNGVQPSLERIERNGMAPDVAACHRGPFGPILRRRAPILEDRGLIARGEREEDVVVVRGRVPVATV
jgi:release factor glutamine methyltransferase